MFCEVRVANPAQLLDAVACFWFCGDGALPLQGLSCHGAAGPQRRECFGRLKVFSWRDVQNWRHLVPVDFSWDGIFCDGGPRPTATPRLAFSRLLVLSENTELKDALQVEDDVGDAG